MIYDDMENDSFYCMTRDFDWETFSPSARNIMDGPSYNLLQVLARFQKSLKGSLAGLDLTGTQFKVLLGLVLLTRDGKASTQMSLANFLKIDKMIVSDVLKTLERKGYVIRANNPNDKRAKSLLVTEKGLKTTEKALEEALAMEREFFSVLGDDRDAFIRMLKKLR